MNDWDETFEEIDANRISLKKHFYVELEKIMAEYLVTKREMEIKKQISDFNNTLRKVGGNLCITKDDMNAAIDKIKTTRRVLNALI